jgi:signal transduction histidine kinase
LAEDIEAQRDLAAAERGDLIVTPKVLKAGVVLQRVQILYARRAAMEQKEIVIGEGADAVELETDERLLSRVLGNLVKNALEASRPGDRVTLAACNDGGVILSVHNQAVMPEVVQAQVFQRLFSTKEGSGRGLGTYSVKLLTEQYLGGIVEFYSTPVGGTTFRLRLPRQLPHRTQWDVLVDGFSSSGDAQPITEVRNGSAES